MPRSPASSGRPPRRWACMCIAAGGSCELSWRYPMTDINIRLAQVDHLDPPSDLWEASTTRVPGPDRPLPSGVQTGWRKAAVIAVAFGVFGAAVLFAWSVLDVEPEPPPPAPASDPFASL